MASSLGLKFFAVFALGLGSAVTPFTVQAQSKPPAVVSPVDNATPLHLALAPDAEPDLTDCAPGNVPNPVVVYLDYADKRPLRAYSIALYYPDVQDREMTRHVEARNIAYPTQPYIARGASWKITFCGVPAGVDPATIHPQVDMLSFDDGTTTGPLELNASFRLLGMADGFSFARGDRSTPPSETPERVDAGDAAERNDESVTVGGVEFTPVFNPKRNTVVIQATNVGDKPVRAYFYKLEFYDPADGGLMHQAKTQVLDPRDADDALLAPHATWSAGPRRVPVSATGQHATMKLTSAFIVYQDGTTFGNASTVSSQELLGILTGVTTGAKMVAAARTD